MLKEIPDEIAYAILTNEKHKADAKAVLNRPTPLTPTFLVTMLIVGLAAYFQSVDQFEAPVWVRIFLIAMVSGSVASIMDSYVIRRRLDAAIFLLQHKQDA